GHHRPARASGAHRLDRAPARGHAAALARAGDRRGTDGGGAVGARCRPGGAQSGGPRTGGPRTSGPRTSGPRAGGPRRALTAGGEDRVMKINHQVVVFDSADLETESTFWAGVLDGTVDRDDDWHMVL